MIRALVEAAQLALQEAAVPGLQAPAIVARTLARLDACDSIDPRSRTPRRPDGLRGREEIDFYARQLEHHALAGDAYQTRQAAWCVVHYLFSEPGEHRNRPEPEHWPDSPTAILDALMPAPRVLRTEMASLAVPDRSPARLGAMLASDARDQRVLALRAMPDEAIEPLSDTLADLLLDERDVDVLYEARSALNNRASGLLHRLRDRFAAAAAAASTGATRAAALAQFQRMDGKIGADQLLAYLTDDAIEVRRVALGWVGETDVRERRPELIEALGHLLGDQPSRWNALVALARFYEEARPVAAQVAACLDDPGCVARVRIVLRRVAPLPPAAIERLQDHLLGPGSMAAREAEQLLEELAPAALALRPTLEQKLSRALHEITSSEDHIVHHGLGALSQLPRDLVEPHLHELFAIGERRVAAGADGSDSMLAVVRRALGRLGIPHDKQPRPGSWMEAYRGITPSEWLDHGTCMVGTIRDDVTTPDGSTFVEALGVWDRATGKPWLIVDNASSLRVVDGCAEAIVLRIVEDVWLIEHYALPSGRLIRALGLPLDVTEWKRPRGIEAITVDGELATIECEHHQVGPPRDAEIVIVLDPSGDHYLRSQ